MTAPTRLNSHATLTQVATTIEQKLIPMLRDADPSALSVSDGLAATCTGALAKSDISAVMIPLSSEIVEAAYAEKGWPTPSKQDIAGLLAGCYKNRVDLAKALIALRAKAQLGLG